ncbi:hypothetical protein [Streptomyces canus]|uniref:hypothetical protein n=1 Tax=Streptomyces canus TaxID=58343 RepID=UPI0038706626|nr:hypothetical protein OH824_17720 [Streptomyces canus]
MTTYQRVATACRMAAVAAVGAAVWTGLRHEWILAAVLAYGSGWLVVLGGLCHRVHLVDQTRHEQARRAANTDPATLSAPLPCCSFWRHSGGAVHGRDCTRPPDARFVRDGLPLDDAETAAFDAITAHALKEL